MPLPVEFERAVPERELFPEYESRYIRDERDPNRFQVNRRVFISDEVLEFERDRIFQQCWLYVGHASEVPEPGSFVTRTVAGQPIILTRDQEGELHVWLNACTHRGAEVCRERKGTTRRFRCFYHSWSFSTDGRLVSLPDQDAFPQGFDTADYGLRAPARVESYRDFVFLNFDPDAMSLHDYLAGARQYLDIVADQAVTEMQVLPGTHEYSVRANWKLLSENSYDGYHAIPVHKTYFDAQRLKGDDSLGDVQSEFKESGAYHLGNGHTVTVKHGPWARPVARWRPSMGAEAKPIVEAAARRLEEHHGKEYADQICNLDFNMNIFPNLVINNIMAVIIRKYEPLRPDLMNVTAWALAPREEDDRAKKVRNKSFLAFLGPAGLATPDDNEALESVQRAAGRQGVNMWSDVSRGFDKDVPMNYDEMHMRTYWRHWDALVTGRAAVGDLLTDPAVDPATGATGEPARDTAEATS